MALQIPIPVQFGDVFPTGAFATRVEAVADFEASKAGQKIQARDTLPPVEFVGLAVTPYLNNSGRVAYSLRADDVRPVGGVAKQASGKTAA